jgi:hypothetical protein
LLLNPRPALQVRKAFDYDEELSLHMQQVPVIEDMMVSAQLQDMVVAGFEGVRRIE